MILKPIDPQISAAHTLPGSFYKSEESFQIVTEKVFARTWQYVEDEQILPHINHYHPFTLLPGVLDEPLLLTRDKENTLRCLSNVCTHRAKVIVQQPGKGKLLQCGYHGRCFRLDGQFKSMPGFDGVQNFPSDADNLPPASLVSWLKLLFVSIEPKVPFDEVFAPILERVSFMGLDNMCYSAEHSRDYPVKANWALYCDNYLEGFHVPFVHPGLNAALDFKNYDYEIFPYCNLQVGVAKEGELMFNLPETSVDYGRNIYAYYFWVFPNLMLNFYPWGLSLNYVRPINHQETMVHFRTYFIEGGEQHADKQCVHQTEIEDEEVVESVQRGIQSRLYKSGRYSATMEKCVHHFHTLLVDFIND